MRRYFASAGSLLEIGCGNGFVLQGFEEAFPQVELTGVELFEEGLAVARSRLSHARLIQADARDLAFDGDFDVVGAFDVLEHIDEDRAVLERMHAAARPGGGLLVTVPQHPALWSAADEYARHRRRYRRGELVEKVRDAGFEVLHVTSFVVLLLPLLASSRIRRKSRSESDPLVELRLSPIVNRLFESITTAELALTERGVSWPAGGSLLLVGRRQP